MKFVFWNIKDKDDVSIGDVIKDLVESELPDILLLAESEITDAFISKNCKLEFVAGVTKTAFGLNKKLKLYAKHKNVSVLTAGYGEGEILTCGLEILNGTKIENYLIFGCHFVSKSTVKDEGKRLKRVARYREYIERTEKDYAKPPVGNPKDFKGSILFGDFNTNPFDLAFTDSSGLFALDIRGNLPNKLKKVNCFINPTFSLIGNYCFRNSGTQSAPGTFYFREKDIEIANEHYWNILDGMIFRPQLSEKYENGDPLEIISEIKDYAGNTVHQLFDFNLHSIDSKYSDHLPIKFSFKL